MMAAHALSEDEFYFGGGIIGAAGVTGNIFHSTDGGETFELETLPGQLNAHRTANDVNDRNRQY